LCETFSFLHIFVAYHQRLVQLNAGRKKKKLGGWGVFEKWDGGMRKSAGTAMKKSRDWGLKNGSLGASNDNNERA